MNTTNRPREWTVRPVRKIPVRDGDAAARKKLRRERIMTALLVLGILAVFALLALAAVSNPSIEHPDFYYWMP